MKTRRAWGRVGMMAILLAGGVSVLQAQTNEPDTNDVVVVAAPAVVTPGRSSRTAAPSGKSDYAAFKIITDRNIFNGNRSGQTVTASRGGSSRRASRVDSFSVVGTLISNGGEVAFFDGTASEYRLALRAGAVAGFRVMEILPSGVRLEEGTNLLDLRVGMAMRREEGGSWKPSSTSVAYASGTVSGKGEGEESSSDTGSASTGGSAADILKRLMEKRAKENQ